MKLATGGHVEAPVVLRVAGLPASHLHRLRFTHTCAGVDAILARLDELELAGASIADALYPVIGGLDGVRKSRVVGLRRAIFQGRRPSTHEWNGDIAAGLPSELAVRIEQWVASREQLKQARIELASTLAAESQAHLGLLKSSVGDKMFVRALSRSSPVLSAELDKWLTGDRTPKSRVVLQLIRYLSRAVAKTSPFSTYTYSGLGSWRDDDIPIRFTSLSPQVTGRTELNGLAVQWIVRALVQRTGRSETLPLRLNPSLTLTDGVYSFLGPPPGESLVSVPANEVMRAGVAAFDGRRSISAEEFLTRLSGSLGDGEAAQRRLRDLLAIGVLEQPMPIPDMSDDPFGQLAQWLDLDGSETATRLAALAAGVSRKVGSPAPVDDLAAFRGYCDDLVAELRALGAAAGLPGEFADDATTLVHDNAVVEEPIAHLGGEAWRPALEDLDVVRSVLPVLDPALPLRLVVAEFFERGWGSTAKVPFLSFHRAIAATLAMAARGEADALGQEIRGLIGAQASPLPILDASVVPRVRELGRVQATLRETFAGMASDHTVRWAQPDDIRQLIAAAPAWCQRTPSSIGCYLQVLTDGPLRLVVNAIHGGHGRGRARLQAIMGRAYTGAEVPSAPVRHSETTLAELGGMFGFTPNIRVKSTVAEIEYPFTASARPERDQIPLGDLVVGMDTDTGMLTVSRTSGESVHPLHLGMMADGLLPPAARLLVQLFGESYYIHPSQPVLVAPESMVIPDQVLLQPRLEIGDVVLQRARWVAPAQLVPSRSAGTTDSEYLVELVDWLRTNGIPMTCFVRKWSADLRTTSGRIEGWVADRSRKPVYVDFANWFLVEVFERMTHAPGPVVIFEEALPEVGESPGPDRADPAVVELLLELSGQEITYGE
ncbi:lantibiotic dehydratase [Nocardia sp. NPDC055053]